VKTGIRIRIKVKSCIRIPDFWLMYFNNFQRFWPFPFIDWEPNGIGVLPLQLICFLFAFF
jgi:hypothetical protein